MAKFTGNGGPVYNANGDGHEGKLSIPIDYVSQQNSSGYQHDLLFEINRVLSSEGNLDRIARYCRSQNSSKIEGLDVVVSKAANLWDVNPEIYSFNSGIPANSAFSRSTPATAWNSSGELQIFATNQPRIITSNAGVPSLILEPAANNLLMHSQEFDEVSWDVNFSVADSHPTELSPTGLGPAGVFTENSSAGALRMVWQDINSIPTGRHTFSLYVKRLTPGRLAGLIFEQPFVGEQKCWFNFSTESIAKVEGAPSTQCSVSSHPNGWYRISISVNTVANSGAVGINLIHPTLGENFAPTGHPGFLIWGAQFESGSVASSHIPTFATPETRAADQWSLRVAKTTLQISNFTLQYELNEPGATLAANLGNSDLIINRNNINFLSAVSTGSFGNGQSQSVQKVNGQITRGGFKLYGNGRYVGAVSDSSLFLDDVTLRSTAGIVQVTEVSMNDRVNREEIMAINSLLTLDTASPYAVLVLGRPGERVQTQPILLNSLAGNSLTGTSHHFDLLENSYGYFGLQGSLNDGTFFDEPMTCQTEETFQ